MPLPAPSRAKLAPLTALLKEISEKIGTDISGFGVDSTANTTEHSNGRSTEPETETVGVGRWRGL